MFRIKQQINKIINHKYFPVVFFLFWFIFYIALSIFRDARLDENIYLGESAVIAKLLQNGKWIGNYGVGLHGFLSKLFVGIIYIFTGPSVFIATFINILFGIGSGIIFFNILQKHFKFNRIYSLLGVTLLFTSYQFVYYMPTFYRDIQALFFVLLIINSILSKKNKWITGIFLLLLLDSKDHVFYALGPALVIWLFLESFLKYRKNTKQIISSFIANGFKLFLPSLIWLILMFTTSVIPLNVYNAKLLGLIRGGGEELIKNFDPVNATYNRDLQHNPDIARVIYQFPITENAGIVITILLTGLNIILSYIGKILYPRTFSFLSLPFLILIPSLGTLFVKCKSYIKQVKADKLLLGIITGIYLLVYIFHASIGRYLIPMLPIFFVYFLTFIRNLDNKRIYIKILIVTLLFVLAGLYFEYSYVWIKVLFSLFILLGFILIILKKSKWLRMLLILLLSFFSLSTVLLSSYRYGQIGSYLKYGYNRECREIVNMMKEDDVIMINDIGWDRLPFVLRSENVQDPEFRWELLDFIPKKHLLIKENNLKTYNLEMLHSKKLLDLIRELDISKVIFVELTDPEISQRLTVEDLKSYKFRRVFIKRMMNKSLYIYETGF